MSDMSAKDHAKAFMCLAITLAIWSCISWPREVMEEAQAQAHMQAHQRVDLGQP